MRFAGRILWAVCLAASSVFARERAVGAGATPTYLPPSPYPIAQAVDAGDVATVASLYAAADPRHRLAALRRAIESRQAQMVDVLLPEVALGNYPEHGLDDVLHLAGAMNEVATIKRLCQRGANPNWSKNPKDRLPLHAALDYAGEIRTDTRGAHALLDCGADPRLPRPNRYFIGSQEHSEIVPVLHDAVATGDVELAKRVISSGIAVNERGGRKQRTALFQNGLSRAMATLLLERGADAKLRDSENVSALTYNACHPGPETGDVIGLLVAAGAPVNDAHPKSGVTALICAARFALIQGVRHLLEAGADPNHLTRGGRSAMGAIAEADDNADDESRELWRSIYTDSRARIQGHADIVALLAAHGARADADPLVVENAVRNGALGDAFIQALQSSWLAQVRECRQRTSPNGISGARASPAARSGKIGQFTKATVTILEGLDDAAEWFSVSPDGRWLAFVRTKQGSNYGTDAVVYDLLEGRSHALKLGNEASGESAVWRADSKAVRYIIAFNTHAVVELSGPTPSRGSDKDYEEAHQAGGDSCGERDERGLLTGKPRRWRPDGQWRLRDPLTAAAYELISSADREVLAITGKEGQRVLVEHDRTWIRDRFQRSEKEFRSELEENVADEPRAAAYADAMSTQFKKWGEQLRPELSHLQLSPNGRYLYYELVVRGSNWFHGPGIFSRRFVVSLQENPASVWEIAEPAVSAYWHPNSQDLLLRLVSESDKDRPEKPARLAVSRFP